MSLHIIKPADALVFLLAGKAKFGLWNQRTDNRFEYEVNASSMKEDGLYFVQLTKQTSNNEHLLGVIKVQYMRNDYIPRFAKQETIESRAFQWLYKKLRDDYTLIPPYVVMYHLGRCARCGRELTDPDSIERGFGSECWRLLNLFS